MSTASGAGAVVHVHRWGHGKPSPRPPVALLSRAERLGLETPRSWPTPLLCLECGVLWPGDPLWPGKPPAHALAVMEDDTVLCADCVYERQAEGLVETMVHAWLADPAGEACSWCGAVDDGEMDR
jgi:hypothetical protein